MDTKKCECHSPNLWIGRALLKKKGAHPIAVALEIIVECELLASLDIFLCEQSDGELPLNEPFLGLAIGRARMVDEAP